MDLDPGTEKNIEAALPGGRHDEERQLAGQGIANDLNKNQNRYLSNDFNQNFYGRTILAGGGNELCAN